MFNDRGRSLLAVGGVLSAVLSIVHVAVLLIGAPAYRYFGAPDEFALQSQAGSYVPALLTGFFALIFGVWAIYGFGGARLIRRPPLVRTGLVVIAGVYLLRGMSVLPEALLLMRTPGAFPPRFIVFSVVSLLIGLAYAIGARQAWRRLGHRDHR
jgi:hypothetical protein